MGHSLISPSNAERVIACPPSVRFTEGMPDRSSEYADEGTYAHLMATHYITWKTKKLPESVHIKALADFQKGKYYSPEMAQHMEEFAEFVKERLPKGSHYLELEQSFDLTKWIPEGRGTGDVVIISDDCIEVIDLKYGKGKRVYADDNAQLKCYALGAAQKYRQLYDFGTVKVSIYQPRVDDGITSEEFSVDDLFIWGDTTLKPSCELAWEGKGEFHSGDHCTFCKGRAVCETRASEQALVAFEDEDAPALPANVLSPERMAKWLRAAPGLSKWLADLEKFALNEALSGRTPEGFKVVEGRSNRVISNQNELITVLQSQDWPRDKYMKPAALLGLTDLEKNLGKTNFKGVVEPYITKPAGKPTLVQDSDKRPAIAAGAVEAFEDETDE